MAIVIPCVTEIVRMNDIDREPVRGVVIRGRSTRIETGKIAHPGRSEDKIARSDGSILVAQSTDHISCVVR